MSFTGIIVTAILIYGFVIGVALSAVFLTLDDYRGKHDTTRNSENT